MLNVDIFDSLKDPKYSIIRPEQWEPVDKNYWRSGWKHTDEAKKLMSDAKKGKPTWNKGKKGVQEQTEKKRKKCAIAGAKGKTNPYRSEESNKKRSEALKQYYADRRAAGYKR